MIFQAIWGAVMTENCQASGVSPQTPIDGFTAPPTAPASWKVWMPFTGFASPKSGTFPTALLIWFPFYIFLKSKEGKKYHLLG